MKEIYKKQIYLLLSCLEIVLDDDRFALKGGTAINLFYRNSPRLSVDIDLTYLPLEDRVTSFKNIHNILKTVSKKLESINLTVKPSKTLNGKSEVKLTVSSPEAQFKIEPNFTIRGNLFPVNKISLCEKSSKEFKIDVNARCLNLAEIYGGKICASLDRQHPRDLFDIKILFNNEGITENIKKSFLFHLISHNRPIDELLNPNFKDISQAYENEFKDMIKDEISLEELVDVRIKLVNDIKKSLNHDDKMFLISFVKNNPDWALINKAEFKKFPSVQWKILNQQRMNDRKREKYIRNLEKLFS